MKEDKQRILLIDDSIHECRTYGSILRTNGHDCVIVHNGLQGLETLENDPKIGLVILDLVMPLMRGEEVLTLIRSKSDYDKIPVVLMSASRNMDEIMVLLDEGGAAEFLSKPIRPKEIISVCEKYLKKK